MKQEVERPRIVWRVETVPIVVSEIMIVVTRVRRIAFSGTFRRGWTRPMKEE
jgi:hypothetical protein